MPACIVAVCLRVCLCLHVYRVCLCVRGPCVRVGSTAHRIPPAPLRGVEPSPLAQPRALPRAPAGSLEPGVLALAARWYWMEGIQAGQVARGGQPLSPACLAQGPCPSFLWRDFPYSPLSPLWAGNTCTRHVPAPEGEGAGWYDQSCRVDFGQPGESGRASWRRTHQQSPRMIRLLVSGQNQSLCGATKPATALSRTLNPMGLRPLLISKCLV